MRTTVMSDALHGQLVTKLRNERATLSRTVEEIDRNAAGGWIGVALAERRTAETELPSLRRRLDMLTQWIDALWAAREG